MHGRGTIIRAPGLFNTLPRVCALGDSITAIGAENLPAARAMNGFGFMGWLSGALNQRISHEPADNFGVSGDNTGMMLARLPAIIARQPTWCVVLAGTNDAVSAVQGTLTYENTITNLTAIYRTLLGAGIGVIAVPILNRSAFAGLVGQPQIDAAGRFIGRVNNWIACFAAGQSELFRIADPRSVWASATGAPPATNSYDGTHPTVNGAFQIAKAIAAQIDGIAPRVDLRFLDPADLWAADNPTGNLLSNGQLAGTGGTNSAANVTGSVPTGWTLVRFPTTALTGTTAISKAARIDGVPGENTVMTFTATAGAFGVCNFNLSQTIFVDEVSIKTGDQIDFMADIEWTNTQGMLGANMQAVEYDGATQVFYTAVAGPAIGGNSLEVPASGSGLFKAPTITVRPSAGGGRNIQFFLQCRANTNQGGGTTGVVKFGGAQARRVPA